MSVRTNDGDDDVLWQDDRLFALIPFWFEIDPIGGARNKNIINMQVHKLTNKRSLTPFSSFLLTAGAGFEAA